MVSFPPADRMLALRVTTAPSSGHVRALLCALAVALLGAAAAVFLGHIPALLLVGSAALAWAVVPGLASWVQRRGLVARPGGRAIHRQATPLLGGVAVYLPVAAYLLWRALEGDGRMAGLLGAVTIMLVVGVVDDVRGLKPRTKLCAEVAAALVLLASGFHIDAVAFPPMDAFATGLLGPPVLVLWVLLVTNAFNLVDGLDGLAASLALIGAVGLALAGADVGAAAVLAGVCLGFLRHNLPRARIFLGDTGSLSLGMLVAGLTLSLPHAEDAVLALAVVAYPLGELGLSVLRRFCRGKPLFAPDRSHVHHKVLALVRSPARALLVILAFAAVQVAVALLLTGVTALVAVALCWIAGVTALVVVLDVRPGRMWRSRKHFRRVHVVHAEVRARLLAARSTPQASRALVFACQELDLSSVDVGPIRIVRTRDAVPPAVVPCVVLELERTFAVWSQAPLSGNPALETEVHTIVTDLLRLAEQRLAAFEAVARRPESRRVRGARRETADRALRRA